MKLSRKFFLNTDIYIYIYISILLAGLIFSCQVEDFDDPKPTARSTFMESVPESLTIHFGDHDIDIDKIVDKFFAEAQAEAQKAPAGKSLSPDDKEICKEQFKKILKSVYNFEDSGPRPQKIEIPISAHDMRTLTGYDWAKPKTFTLTMDYSFELPLTNYVKISEELYKYLTENEVLPADTFNDKHEMNTFTFDVRNLLKIDVSDRKIKSLEGIQYFRRLAYLDCSNNNLTTLDISKNLVGKFPYTKKGAFWENTEESSSEFTRRRKLSFIKTYGRKSFGAEGAKVEKQKHDCPFSHAGHDVKPEKSFVLKLKLKVDGNVQITDYYDTFLSDLENFKELDKKKLPSTVDKNDIKALGDLKYLLDDDIDLNFDDTAGTLTVTIKNHGEPKEITLTKFQTTKAEPEPEAPSEEKLTAVVQDLSTDSIAGYTVDSTKKASDVDHSEIIAAIKAIDGLSALPDSDIEFSDADDDAGTLKVTIKNHGEPKEITLTKFQTTKAEPEPEAPSEEKLTAVVQDLSTDSIAGYTVDSTKKASDVDHSEIIAAIKAIDGLSALPDSDIEFSDADDDAGTLKVTIKNHGEPKEITLTKFQTTKAEPEPEAPSEEKLTAVVQDLSTDSIAGYTVDSTKKASDVDHSEIIAAIKAIDGLSALPDSDIEFSDADDDAGTLKVTIKNHGEPKEITLTKFQTTKAEPEPEAPSEEKLTAVVQDLSTDSIAGYTVDSTKKASDVDHSEIIAAIKAIDGLSALPDSDIEFSDADDDAGTLKVTIKNHGEPKEITLTGFKPESIPSSDILQFVSKFIDNNLSTLELASGAQIADDTNTKNAILDAVKALSEYKKLSTEKKALIVSAFAADNLTVTPASGQDPASVALKTPAKKIELTVARKPFDLGKFIDDNLSSLELPIGTAPPAENDSTKDAIWAAVQELQAYKDLKTDEKSKVETAFDKGNLTVTPATGGKSASVALANPAKTINLTVAPKP